MVPRRGNSGELLLKVNLLLFEKAELTQALQRTDPRARHLLTVLRRQPGESFDAGIVDGPCGKGTIVDVSADALILAFTWGPEPPPLEPIALIVGLPRPQTARDILREATTLGVASLSFVTTERGDPNYASSSLWAGEWKRHVRAGAEQAFDTRMPQVAAGLSLDACLAGLHEGGSRLALDNYEAGVALGRAPIPSLPITLAIGAERGWSARERDLLRSAQFTLVHLGTRVLRTETAVVAALALIRSRLGLL